MTNPFGEIKWIFNFRNASSRRNIFFGPLEAEFRIQIQIAGFDSGLGIIRKQTQSQMSERFWFPAFSEHSFNFYFASLRYENSDERAARLIRNSNASRNLLLALFPPRPFVLNFVSQLNCCDNIKPHFPSFFSAANYSRETFLPACRTRHSEIFFFSLAARGHDGRTANIFLSN